MRASLSACVSAALSAVLLCAVCCVAAAAVLLLLQYFLYSEGQKTHNTRIAKCEWLQRRATSRAAAAHLHLMMNACRAHRLGKMLCGIPLQASSRLHPRVMQRSCEQLRHH
jgi:hypothetical protein